jgi:hypothetical protein
MQKTMFGNFTDTKWISQIFQGLKGKDMFEISHVLDYTGLRRKA